MEPAATRDAPTHMYAPAPTMVDNAHSAWWNEQTYVEPTPTLPAPDRAQEQLHTQATVYGSWANWRSEQRDLPTLPAAAVPHAPKPTVWPTPWPITSKARPTAIHTPIPPPAEPHAWAMYGCFDLSTGPAWHAAPVPEWPLTRTPVEWHYSPSEAELVLFSHYTGRILLRPAHDVAGAVVTIEYLYEVPAPGHAPK